MRKGKFREKVDIFTEKRYYEVVFYALLEKTAENIKIDKKELLNRWCKYTETDFEILSRALTKLGFSTHIHLKFLLMKALAYFGVTVRDMKNVFCIKSNYTRIPNMKFNVAYNTCTEEEIKEIKKLIDELIYLVHLFKYIKFDENGIVLKEHKENNKQIIVELYVRTVLFYYNKRFRNLFPTRVDKPIWALGNMIIVNTAEVEYINNKLHGCNYITIGEVRSLLYHAFGVTIEDAKELLPNSVQNINYLYRKYKDRNYKSILDNNEFDVLERFLKVLYDNTKYICCLKGVPNGE